MKTQAPIARAASLIAVMATGSAGALVGLYGVGESHHSGRVRELGDHRLGVETPGGCGTAREPAQARLMEAEGFDQKLVGRRLDQRLLARRDEDREGQMVGEGAAGHGDHTLGRRSRPGGDPLDQRRVAVGVVAMQFEGRRG